METILFGTKVATLVTLVGKDLIFASVSTTAGAVMSTFSYLTGVDKPGLSEFKKRMKELDLENTIMLLGAFVKEIEERTQGDKDKIPNSLHIALNGVDACLKEINDELDHVKDKIEKHNGLWFKGMRPTSFENSIKRMNKYHAILMIRKEDLLKLASYHKLAPKE